MELSHTAIPITLSWHELNYDIMVPSFRTPRSILSYVSGWGEPNDMVAFLGNHGAGKTTLLNCLSGILGHASYDHLKPLNFRDLNKSIFNYFLGIWIS